ncbi:hypothetical protein PTKIN_Ptkin01aG0313100 [Pterospermum kingtungense]
MSRDNKLNIMLNGQEPKATSVIDCKTIKGIIACEGDGDGIVFSKLEFLQLSALPRLASFCLRDHFLELPALEKLIVKECPKLEISKTATSAID